MKNSVEKIHFITEYISAYEEKIKLLNTNGLFDAAKLFELFAIEVGRLYLGQDFNNLNIETSNYPCVDLISSDGQTYMQVSTVKEMPSKIKTTLERIRDSKKNEIKALTNVKFFMLSNESEDKVKDYIGKSQIGNIPFSKATDLITTNDILQKSKDDFDFQNALYKFLKSESENINNISHKFCEAVENSKIVMLRNIDCKINNEYEIDRSALIQEIKGDRCKNISIQGAAGFGKSVLCMKLIESEENMLYARAERLREETDLNNVWGFNIRQTFEYLGDRPLVIFVDALEFIADIPTKLDLLHVLYDIANKYDNVKIITSCRTSDKNSFIKTGNMYSVKSYEVSELTIGEQLSIANRYPIIKQMMDIASYVDLLKSPFYINLIVSQIASIDSISDENELREYIWKNVICKDAPAKTIESIVFERAKHFTVGASRDDFDSDVIDKLVSTGVLVENGNKIRLKYDIFEDICFEQYLDSAFEKSKGKYSEFFSDAGFLGRCIYRRYQIWISNKLLAKNNRERFLYELIFSDTIPQNWKKQTEVGLVKSQYCREFFTEYGQTMIGKGILNDFIRTTNLYAFEVDPYFALSSYIQLKPCGEGRKSIINIVVENKVYERDIIPRSYLEKLCTDYSNAWDKDQKTAENASLILIHILETAIEESSLQNYYRLTDTIISLLASIYRLSEYSKDWIKAFWTKQVSLYKSNNRDEVRLSGDIIKDTLKFSHVELAIHLPVELCALAEIFWTHASKEQDSDEFYGFHYRKKENTYLYGLSKEAEDYETDSNRNKALYSCFFLTLFKRNFWTGLRWATNFINKTVAHLNNELEEGLLSYEIHFVEDDTKKSYLGHPEMWQVALEDHNMPMIVGDLVYCLKEMLHSTLKSTFLSYEDKVKFAENVKKYIFENSDNIVLLTVISDVGMAFKSELPGFALDLATNINIIHHDLTRLVSIIKDPTRELLEQQICMIMGMPPSLLPDRYNKKKAKEYDLQRYVAESQLLCEKTQFKCHKILDYLYSVIPNDEENAVSHLQIQKMDLRTAKALKVDDTTYAFIPTVTGEAKKITDENEKQRKPENEIFSLVKSSSEKLSENKLGLSDCLEVITKLRKEIDSISIPTSYEMILFGFISFALNNKELDEKIRTEFCHMWISGIRSYFTGGSFIIENSHSWVLFKQLEFDSCSKETKDQIKRLILDLILHDDHHGIITELARIAKIYLSSNQPLAQCMFNTIIKLAEDEMDHQKFNAEYIRSRRKKEKFEFRPNMQPKLIGVDSSYIKDDSKRYQSKRSKIVQEYLLGAKQLDLSDFNSDDYDVETLCYVTNCGLSFENARFVSVVKELMKTMINVWRANEKTHDSHKIITVYSCYEVMSLFQNELKKGAHHMENTLDILFTDIDFSQFTHEAMEFYLDVFGCLLVEYFNSHSDKAKRAGIVTTLRSLESKIKAIKEKTVKINLYKTLILSPTRYVGSDDWTKIPSGYSYQDKCVLNELFSAYGGYHLRDMLGVIYKLHIDKLLPEILLSVRDAILHAKKIKTTELKSKTTREMKNDETIIILTIITKAFFDFANQIKEDSDLTTAYEEILEVLAELNYEEAATILDEFRVH